VHSRRTPPPAGIATETLEAPPGAAETGERAGRYIRLDADRARDRERRGALRALCSPGTRSSSVRSSKQIREPPGVSSGCGVVGE